TLVFRDERRLKMANVPAAKAWHPGLHVRTIVRSLVQHVLQPAILELVSDSGQHRGKTAFVSHFVLIAEEECISTRLGSADPVAFVAGITVERNQGPVDAIRWRGTEFFRVE